METDLELGDGRTLHVYDTGDAYGRLAVFWHHGTPNIGAPPEPLFAAAEDLGIRWVSYDRAGYGRSTPDPGRNLASAAAGVSAVADRLGIDRFALMGHSGGGSHALAPSGVASLGAAAEGRVAKERFQASDAEYDPEFTAADHAALEGEWSWFADVVGPAVEGGPGGLIDDDLAYVSPWGVDPTGAKAPILLLHGGRDRVVPSSHGEWLARHCPSTDLRLYADDGHISVLNQGAAALEWLRRQADGFRAS